MKSFYKKFLVVTVLGLICALPMPSMSDFKTSMTPIAHAEDASRFKTVRASHILVETEDEAWALKSRLTEGESFEKLAKEYSKCPSKDKGGDLGYFNRGQMVPDFEYAAFSTPVGQISDPVKTKFGWHLIKVTRKMPLR